MEQGPKTQHFKTASRVVSTKLLCMRTLKLYRQLQARHANYNVFHMNTEFFHCFCFLCL